MSVGYEYEDFSGHPWCSDPARDEAVRAAEDGRDWPLPTLEEAIAAITNHDAPPGARVSDRQCASSADTGADTAGAGLRTERVTLEVTHDCAFQASEWVLEVVQEACSEPGEPVRVVDESVPAVHRGSGVFDSNGDEVPWEGVVAALKSRVDYLERDRKFWALQSGWFEKEANALKARVAELEAAPAASGNCQGILDGSPAASGAANSPESPVSLTRGWLTEKERSLIESLANTFQQKADALRSQGLHGHVDNWERKVKLFRSLLARSSPPEVVHPECVFDEFSGCSAVRAWNICAVDFRKALAAAGVAVKEAGSE